MARFSKEFRGELPNKVARHFDKYIEYTNPLTFCPLQDVYRAAFTEDEWTALNLLMDRKIGRECFNRYGTFDLYVSKSNRTHITFEFPDGRRRPSLDIHIDQLTDEAQKKIMAWIKTAVSYRKLRQFMRQRIVSLLNWGWERGQTYDYNRNCWRGGPTSGQGCNTVGQVNRIWPELLVFFPAEMIGAVRNASMKSRLPSFFKLRKHTLTPEQFMLQDRLFHDRDETEPYSDEEMEFERRKLKAVNHILVQMSLIKDVPNVDKYPEITLA